MEEKYVSVIIPVYNVENLFLSQCLNSLENQTCENYEVIIVSDGAKESVIEVCKQYCKRNNKFKLIEQENSGVSVARNKGIEVANGEWVMFVDADDWVKNNAIELYLKHVKNGDDIVISNYYAFNNGKIHEQEFFNSNDVFSANNNENIILDLIMSFENRNSVAHHGVPWGKLYNKKLLIKNNIKFPKGMVRFQDNIFNLYCFLYAKNITYFDNYLYYYRIHENSVTRNSNNYKIEYTRRFIFETFNFCNKYMNTKEAKLRTNVKIFFLTNVYLKSYFLNEKDINYSRLKKDIEENILCYWQTDVSILSTLSLRNKLVYFILKLNMYRLIRILLPFWLRLK